MKNIDEIMNMSTEQLEKAAEDLKVRLSDDAKDRLKLTLAVDEEINFAKEGRSIHKRIMASLRSGNKRYYQWMSIAVAACIAVLAVVGYNNRTPKDTYTDPYQAYAEVEKAFALISTKSAKGIQIAQSTTKLIEKPSNVIKSVDAIKFK